MLKNLIKLFKDEEGATALEYGLMAAAVAGVLIVVAFFLGGKVSNSINNVAEHIKAERRDRARARPRGCASVANEGGSRRSVDVGGSAHVAGMTTAPSSGRRMLQRT